MKKILLILFFMTLLIGTVSAWDFDNIGRYNETARTFTIRNSVLGIPFLQLGTVAEIHLDTPDVVGVFRGKDRKVAEFTINNYGSYSNAFKKMEFHDIKNNMNKFEREFTYKYKKSLGFETVNDYETICEDKTSLNGTKYQECYKKLTGTHQEERFEWVELDTSKKLPTGQITIGIFTDVYAGDNVEWIPTLFGVRINEWATWTDNFDVGLVAYYAFDEDSGTNLPDVTGQGYDGTTINMEDGDWVTGKIGNALEFDGVDEFVNISHDNALQPSSISISIWVNASDFTKENAGFIMKPPTNLVWSLFTAGTGVIWRGGGSEGTLVGDHPTNNEWHHFVITQTGNSSKLYIDGILNISSEITNAIGSDTSPVWIAKSAFAYHEGTIDEIGIWNRTLNETQIQNLWNNGEGISPVADLPPKVSLISPVDNYNSTDPTITFNGTVSDDINLINVSLYIDGILNETNFSGINNTNYLFTKTILDGNHNWTYEACDNRSQCTTATRTFAINTTPNIQFENPTPVNEYNSSTINHFIANVSLTETYFQNLTFYLYNLSGLYDSTIYTDSTRHINWTDMPDGKYSYNVTVRTNTSQSNSTETRNITIDINPPIINITYPTATINYHLINTNLSLNWTVSDINLDSCWYNYNGTNITVTCSDNHTNINITGHSNKNVTFYANDTYGKINSDYQEWDYKVFEVQQTFSPVTIEGSTETFINNIFLGNGEVITEINFNYNGTDKSVEYLSLGENEYNFSSTFIIPSVEAETNISFFWKIFLVSGQINSSLRNQTVKSIGIDNCSVFSNVIFEYTIVDEESQSSLINTTTLELDIEIFDETKTISILNFSTKYNNTNPASVCLSIDLTNDTVYALDSTAKYEASTNNATKNYSIEYYNIQNFLLRNSTIPQEINLFDLLLIDSTEFQITFKDSNFVAVENALIQINRQYLSEGLFKTVEIPKTDSNGQTVAHLVEKDVVYNIIVLKEGEVLGTFNNIIAFCEDVLIGSCFISLNALVKGEVSFDYDADIGLFYDFEYNETSRDLQFDFSTTDGSVKNVTLSALKIDQLGNETVCDGYLVSSGGSIFCPVPVSVGNETIIVSIFVEGDLKITNYVQAGREFDIGDAGYFLMFFLVLSLALMMTQSKTGVIIGVILGFISGVLLSFVQGGLVGVGSSVIWLIIMGVILIYKLNSQGQT